MSNSSLYDTYKPRSLAILRQQQQQAEDSNDSSLPRTLTPPQPHPPTRTTHQPHEARPLYLTTQTTPAALGSSYLEAGNTKLFCSVYPPSQRRRLAYSSVGHVFVDCKYSTSALAQRPESGSNRGQSENERQLSITLQQMIEPCIQLQCYPKSVIEVYLLVVDDDGSILSHGVNAIALALADAGIRLHDLVASATIIQNPQGQQLLIDPTSAEQLYHTKQQQGTSTLTVAYMPTLQQFTHSQVDGEFDEDDYIHTLELACKQCESVVQHMQSVIKQNLQRHIKQLQAAQDGT